MIDPVNNCTTSSGKCMPRGGEIGDGPHSRYLFPYLVLLQEMTKEGSRMAISTKYGKLGIPKVGD